MINYDKSEIRQQVTLENVFDIVEEWGGTPEYTAFGLLATTICHNHPGEGSHKLYYYENSGLFKCYTECDEAFDIFQLIEKIFKIQKNEDLDLNDCVRYIANRLGISGTELEVEDKLNSEDWKILNNYERIQNLELKDYHVTLKEYDQKILNNLNYNLKISPWLKEGISQEAIEHNKIGYYLGGD